MPEETKYRIENFSDEEGAVVKAALEATLDQHSATLSMTGLGDGVLGCKVIIVKKVPITDEPVVSPLSEELSPAEPKNEDTLTEAAE